MSILYTERLILRPFQPNDAEAMFRNWTQDTRVAAPCRWYPHKSIDETKGYLDFCMHNKYCWAITLKEKDEPIGAIDLVGQNKRGIDEIGYVLMYDQWSKGLMTEAATAVIHELFAQGFDAVEACHRVDNPASGKVMQKCGMTYTHNEMVQAKFGSEEQCEVSYYHLDRPATN